MNIPKHQRDNYEATSFAIGQLEAIAAAAEIVVERHPQMCGDEPESRALDHLLREMFAKVAEVRHLHSLEWVGLGGRDDSFTPKQIATAQRREARQGRVTPPPATTKGRAAEARPFVWGKVCLTFTAGRRINVHTNLWRGDVSAESKTFSSAEAAAAADVSANTLQNWLKRGVIVGHRPGDIKGGGSQGKHRRLSFSAVMQIAVANDLIGGGICDLKNAFLAASKFAHFGDEDRKPGFPHPPQIGRTVVCLSGDRSEVRLWKPGGDLLLEAQAMLGRSTVTTVNATAVFERVVKSLGHDPAEVLREVYKEAAD
jgi:hypothetical protein